MWKGGILQQTVDPIACSGIAFCLYKQLQAVGKRELVDLSGLEKGLPVGGHTRHSQTLKSDFNFFHVLNILFKIDRIAYG